MPPRFPAPHSLAIALGANLGDAAATFAAVRPLLAEILRSCWRNPELGGPTTPWLRWSPRFRTEPVGGPPGQPPYLNAVVVAGPLHPPGSGAAPPDPGALLAQLQALEGRFGRERRERWGPRSLDLDLLWWGETEVAEAALTLPHPRLAERTFVLAPLAAIDPARVPPGCRRSCGELLAELLPAVAERPPERLPPGPGWPE